MKPEAVNMYLSVRYKYKLQFRNMEKQKSSGLNGKSHNIDERRTQSYNEHV